MKIQYKNVNAFYDGINELLVRGIEFRADHESLTIFLTGGY